MIEFNEKKIALLKALSQENGVCDKKKLLRRVLSEQEKYQTKIFVIEEKDGELCSPLINDILFQLRCDDMIEIDVIQIRIDEQEFFSFIKYYISKQGIELLNGISKLSIEATF